MQHASTSIDHCDDEAGPTELNTLSVAHTLKESAATHVLAATFFEACSLQVDKDKLTVTYTGKGNHAQDVGVRAHFINRCTACVFVLPTPTQSHSRTSARARARRTHPKPLHERACARA
jgi:hypothetical protein